VLSRPDSFLSEGHLQGEQPAAEERGVPARSAAGSDRRRGQDATGLAGLAAVDELALRLGMVASFDAGIGVIKQRDRGLSAGQLLVGMASGQLVGQDHLAGLDRVREDAGSALLEQAPVAPSTTAGGWPVPSPRSTGRDRGRADRRRHPLAGAGPSHGPGTAGAARPDDRPGLLRHRGLRPDHARHRLELHRRPVRAGAPGELGASRTAVGDGADGRQRRRRTPRCRAAAPGPDGVAGGRPVAGRGSVPTPATSTPPSRTPPSTPGATSRSPRSATGLPRRRRWGRRRGDGCARARGRRRGDLSPTTVTTSCCHRRHAER